MEQASRRCILDRHQCCYWERLNILSDSMKCNHLPRNTSSLLYPESCQHEKWTSLKRKSVHVLRLPPKISLKHEWKRELGSEHAQRSEAGQLTFSLQFKQPTLNRKTRYQGMTRELQDGRKTSRSREIDVNSFREGLGSSERTVLPVTGKTNHDTSVNQARSSEEHPDRHALQPDVRQNQPFNPVSPNKKSGCG